MTKSVLRSLFYFDYNFPQMTVRAFEDFMKGPTFFQSSDPESLHASILEFNKQYKSRERSQGSYSIETFYQKPKYILLKKIIGLFTLNGHLQPKFISRKNEAFVLFGSPNQWYKAFAKNKIIFFKEEDSNFYQNTFDRATGIGLLIKWLQIAITSSMKWSSVCAEWKKVATELASNDYWHRYLKLKN
jgi:galactofuranosylgalactofuranosylrhamnosyl-N-acetylglucosaminyl-diphospho-decaprenol beta-1,5/1,6-galactofuranosyltransferase